MWENTIVIHNVLKKKNYKAKFSTNSILKKKFDKYNFEKNKIIKQTMWGNIIAIHNIL